MLQFNQYESNGRTQMIRFTCRRCGVQEIVPLTREMVDDTTYGNLHFVKPPQGWEELSHGPLLCPACVEAYKDFMNYSKE